MRVRATAPSFYFITCNRCGKIKSMKHQIKKIIIGVVIGIIITSGVFFLITELNNRGTQEEVSTCQNLPELPNKTTKRVTKVIDGDTFIIEGGHPVRLLGIDADESGYPCYEEAKQKLEELVLKKEVKLIKGNNNHDQYCRYLRYPFINDKNISLQLVKRGFATSRFSANQTKYKDAIRQAEQKAQENKVGCEWSNSTSEESNNDTSNLKWSEITGGEVVGACQAGKYKGENIIVEGEIVDTYHDRESNTVFLNFSKPYPNHCFNTVIFGSNLNKFVEDPEDYYNNKTVRVKGEVKIYQEKPEIILKDPNQIEIGQ